VRGLWAISLVVAVAACTPGIPKEALQLSQESLQRRQLQTREFDTADEASILSASAGVLQDLGFNLDESETHLGVIVASKDRDATETGQVVGAVLLGVLFGTVPPVDKTQKIRVSLVTRPIGAPANRIAVRVTFQRLVWNTNNQLSKIEAVDDAPIYQQFYDKLSKSVFLEAHGI
jgi:hypothetical protein